MKKKPKAISLFSGAGGCSLGFKMAGYETIYANDIDKAAIETYKTNFPDTDSDCIDVNQVDFNHILKKNKLSKGEVDILIGGPPCQGFSTAGTRFWDDPRNHLLKQYIKALEVVQPKWFLMENVEGLLTSNKGIYVYETVKAFLNLGYSVRVEKIYAHEYSVPQRRKRVIIIGNRMGIEFEFPKPVSYSSGKIFRKSELTLSDALYGLPKASTSNNPIKIPLEISNSWANRLYSKEGLLTDHVSPKLDDLQLSRISILGEGQTMKDLPDDLQHPSFKKRASRRVMDGTPSEKRGGAPSGLKRLKSGEPCLTITGAAIREFVHPHENRFLTIRECARIQSFPDDFKFYGNTSQKIQQIGNAIPPFLAEIFGNHIQEIGFNYDGNDKSGRLLGFKLSKSNGLSPALCQTQEMLSSLCSNNFKQLSIFDHAD